MKSEKNTKYVVMRLLESIEVDNGLNKVEVRLQGMDGYLPVFNTYKDALPISQNNYYPIVTINVLEEEDEVIGDENEIKQ